MTKKVTRTGLEKAASEKRRLLKLQHDSVRHAVQQEENRLRTVDMTADTSVVRDVKRCKDLLREATEIANRLGREHNIHGLNYLNDTPCYWLTDADRKRMHKTLEQAEQELNRGLIAINSWFDRALRFVDTANMNTVVAMLPEDLKKEYDALGAPPQLTAHVETHEPTEN